MLAAELNTYKAMRVSRRRCVGYAARLGLEPCIQTAIGFRRSDGGPGPEDSMLAEAFEAVLGAMFQVRFCAWESVCGWLQAAATPHA